MAVADPALPFQKRQAVQRQDGPDHVLADPLGPFVAEEPLADRKRQDLPAEDLGQARNRSTTGYAHFTLEFPCPFAA
jgi:hypothetical protein